MATLIDPHDRDYALHVEVTDDPMIVEVRATDGLRSVTLDVTLRDLQDAIDEARANARLALT